MNELKIFEHPDFGDVRVLQEGDKTLFCGSDIAKVLGYSKPQNAISDHCKGALKRGIPTNGGTQEMLFIPEGDVYRLIVKSRLPEAERFERWVFDEVLPSIRKTGGYITGQESLSETELMAKALLVAQRISVEKDRKIENLETNNAALTQQIAELQPKASYYDTILQSKTALSVSKISKDYGWSAVKMNRYLQEKGIQFKKSGMWFLYQKYAEKGYTQTYTFAIDADKSSIQTRWTQKGRLFLYELLKQDGILPLCEIQDEDEVE